MMFHTPPLPQDGQGALSHDILAVLGIEPSWVMRAEPMAGGYSEARLWRLRSGDPFRSQRTAQSAQKDLEARSDDFVGPGRRIARAGEAAGDDQ